MWKDVAMAVPKTTETRCRDGSVQAKSVIQNFWHSHPYIFQHFLINTSLYPLFQYNSSLKSISFLQASFRIHETNNTATR